MASLTVREVRKAFGATAVIHGTDIAIPDQILSGIEAAFGRHPVFVRGALGSGYGVQPGPDRCKIRRAVRWYGTRGQYRRVPLVASDNLCAIAAPRF